MVTLGLVNGVTAIVWSSLWSFMVCGLPLLQWSVEEHHYHRAIVFLTSMSLDDITANFREKKANLNIGDIVRCYRDMSGTQLTTLQDLLRFMLTIKSRAPPPSEYP